MSDYSDAELRAAAQGCTEVTCLYHGRFNAERYDRRDRDRRHEAIYADESEDQP